MNHVGAIMRCSFVPHHPLPELEYTLVGQVAGSFVSAISRNILHQIMYTYKYIYITHTYVFMCIHMYSYVFICIHMNSYEFICIHDLREEGKHAILCHHPSSLQTPTRYHPISGITQKKQIPSTPSNQPPFHPSNSHYGKRLSTYHSNLQAYTNEP